MTDQDLRLEALKLAVAHSAKAAPNDAVFLRAEAFLSYLARPIERKLRSIGGETIAYSPPALASDSF